MRKYKIHRLSFTVLVGCLLVSFQSKAQEVENDFQYRTNLKISYKPIKDVKINFTPEIRFGDQFQFDQYLVEWEVVYSPLKRFNLGASYQFKGNKTGSGDFENRNKYALFIEANKKLKRFTPSLKMSYTNSADDDLKSHFLRYKASIDYNIRKSKLTPEISLEAFHDLGVNDFYKMRYTAGINYKIFKNNSIGIGYKLDYYLQEYHNKHIFSIGYKFKF